MASHPVIYKLSNFAFFGIYVMITMLAVFVSSFQFQVGGEKGWIKPTPGNQTANTYNRWATQNRFHVGDALYFKYKKDSVLVVNYTSYHNCIVSNPIYKFSDGNTVFLFDRHGFYYFISGNPAHCKAGQKLVIRVMVQSESMETAPESAPSPKVEEEGGGDGWDSLNLGPLSQNSTDRLCAVASYFMTALGGVLVVLYLFI